MKPILSILVFTLLLCACGPKQNSIRQLPFVIDSAEILTMNQSIDLRNLYIYTDLRIHHKLGLLTIKDYKPENDLRTYGIKYFEKNKIDANDSGNHVLILFCAERHSVEVFSSKESISFNDSTVHAVVNQVMIPQFRYNRDYEGLMKGSEALIALLEKGK